MKHLIPAIALFTIIATSCTGRCTSPQPVHEEMNAVYYWKTVFQLDSADIAFMGSHDIGRVYLRMFDVTEDPYAVTVSDRAVPNATVRMDYGHYELELDSLSHVEFVPTVYITLDALKAMNGQEGVLASNIVTRVRNMCQYHNVPNVAELQLDCDWTASTESSFFALCDSVKHDIADLQLPWRLSSTIRLHQLSRKIPPVDNGVLMVYNTGNFSDPDAANSIIDAADVEPYLRHLPSYPLHLDVAYPTYSWQLLFRKRQFVGLMSGMNLTDTAQFARKGENVYIARRDIPYNDRIIREGDCIREEVSAFPDVARVKALIERHLPAGSHSNILYHLDSKNLSRYTPDEIDDILSAGR